MGNFFSNEDDSKQSSPISNPELLDLEIPMHLTNFINTIKGKWINIAMFIERPMTIREPYLFIITIKGNTHHIRCGGYYECSLTESTSLQSLLNHDLLSQISSMSTRNKYFLDEVTVYNNIDKSNLFPYSKLNGYKGNINDDLQAKYPYFVEDVISIPFEYKYSVRSGPKWDDNTVTTQHTKKTFDVFLVLKVKMIGDRIMCKWIFIRSEIWSELPTDLMNLIITYLSQEVKKKYTEKFGWRGKASIGSPFVAIVIRNYDKALRGWELSDVKTYSNC